MSISQSATVATDPFAIASAGFPNPVGYITESVNLVFNLITGKYWICICSADVKAGEINLYLQDAILFVNASRIGV